MSGSEDFESDLACSVVRQYRDVSKQTSANKAIKFFDATRRWHAAFSYSACL